MNIFVLDKDPIKAAEMMADQHINKMIVESAQMLANCLTIKELCKAPRSQKGNIRKYSYLKHPCSLWAKSSKNNMFYLLSHAKGLIKERAYRWPDKQDHFSTTFINHLDDIKDRILLPELGLTEFAVAISEDQECRKRSNFDKLDPISKYRLYYTYDKNMLRGKPSTWTKREKPKWIKELRKNG